jgi:L-seryl-tRNA(Ser) seleniumtransferase
MRAVRPDKLQLAALAATLALYRDGRAGEVPVVAALAVSGEALRTRANELASRIGEVAGLRVAVEPCESAVGGGAMPTAKLASWAITLAAAGRGADELDAALRGAAVPVIARVADDRVWLDVRTVAAEELAEVAAAVRGLGA